MLNAILNRFRPHVLCLVNDEHQYYSLTENWPTFGPLTNLHPFSNRQNE